MSVPIYLPAWMVESGQGIPTVCCKHGQPAVKRRKMTFKTPTPTWVNILALCTLLIAAIIQLSMEVKIVSPGWPLCWRCVREHRTQVLSAWGTLVGGTVLCIALGAAGLGDLGFVLWFVVLIAAFAFTVRAQWQRTVPARVDKNSHMVVVRHVHPGFVAALPTGPPPQQVAPAGLPRW